MSSNTDTVPFKISMGAAVSNETGDHEEFASETTTTNLEKTKHTNEGITSQTHRSKGVATIDYEKQVITLHKNQGKTLPKDVTVITHKTVSSPDKSNSDAIIDNETQVMVLHKAHLPKAATVVTQDTVSSTLGSTSKTDTELSFNFNIGEVFLFKDEECRDIKAQVTHYFSHRDTFQAKLADTNETRLFSRSELQRICQNKTGTNHYAFKAITGHRYAGSRKGYLMRVLWQNNEETEVPLKLLQADDPVTCAFYGFKHNLLNKPGWKALRCFLSKEQVEQLPPMNHDYQAHILYHQCNTLVIYVSESLGSGVHHGAPIQLFESFFTSSTTETAIRFKHKTGIDHLAIRCTNNGEPMMRKPGSNVPWHVFLILPKKGIPITDEGIRSTLLRVTDEFNRMGSIKEHFPEKFQVAIGTSNKTGSPPITLDQTVTEADVMKVITTYHPTADSLRALIQDRNSIGIRTYFSSSRHGIEVVQQYINTTYPDIAIARPAKRCCLQKSPCVHELMLN